jgi:hypothetical protein
VPDALYYEVLASSTLNNEQDFRRIAQVRETDFTDSDLSSPRRYYQIRAVLEESVDPALHETASTSAAGAALRVPDLRWNLKLGSSTTR